jgi:hypothetical protein
MGTQTRYKFAPRMHLRGHVTCPRPVSTGPPSSGRETASLSPSFERAPATSCYRPHLPSHACTQKTHQCSVPPPCHEQEEERPRGRTIAAGGGEAADEGPSRYSIAQMFYANWMPWRLGRCAHAWRVAPQQCAGAQPAGATFRPLAGHKDQAPMRHPPSRPPPRPRVSHRLPHVG